MGWRGTFRTIVAISRRIERENERQQRAIHRAQLRQARQNERDLKAWNKERAFQDAKEEVEDHEALLLRLLSIHKDCSEICDWKAIQESPPPPSPERRDAHEAVAVSKLNSFAPSIFEKAFGKADEKRALLEQQVSYARQLDEQEYQVEYAAYLRAHADWVEQTNLATSILNGDLDACRDAVAELNPFGDITEIGSSITFRMHHSSFVEIEMKVNGEHVIPKETKKLLQSGKVSAKPMGKRQFFEIYQDFVCGSVLRIVREVLALLPVEHVVVNAVADALNTETGHIEESTILSLYVPRSTANRINWENVDPSDALRNFSHSVGFERGEGFHPIERLDISVSGS